MFVSGSDALRIGRYLFLLFSCVLSLSYTVKAQKWFALIYMESGDGKESNIGPTYLDSTPKLSTTKIISWNVRDADRKGFVASKIPDV